jgi:hypothetical protein
MRPAPRETRRMSQSDASASAPVPGQQAARGSTSRPWPTRTAPGTECPQAHRRGSPRFGQSSPMPAPGIPPARPRGLSGRQRGAPHKAGRPWAVQLPPIPHSSHLRCGARKALSAFVTVFLRLNHGKHSRSRGRLDVYRASSVTAAVCSLNSTRGFLDALGAMGTGAPEHEVMLYAGLSVPWRVIRIRTEHTRNPLQRPGAAR